MTTTTHLPSDAYLRVSDKDGREGDSYHSPTDQLDDIVTRAPSFGIASIAERVLEDDLSGKTAAEDRKLERLIRRVESRQSGGIVTAKLDRFGRGLVHGSLALRRIVEAGGRLVWVNDGIDSDAPGSKLNIQMRLAIAAAQASQAERRLTSGDSLLRIAAAPRRVVGLGHPGARRPLAGR